MPLKFRSDRCPMSVRNSLGEISTSALSSLCPGAQPQSGLCWWTQGRVIMLVLSCSWYPPLMVLRPLCSVPCLQSSVWEPGQHHTAPDFQPVELSACRWIKGITSCSKSKTVKQGNLFGTSVSERIAGSCRLHSSLRYLNTYIVFATFKNPVRVFSSTFQLQILLQASYFDNQQEGGTL